MRIRGARRAFVLLALLAEVFASSSVRAAVSIPLEIDADPIVENVGGVPVTLVLSGSLALTEAPNGAEGTLQVTVDLADLQAKILKVVRAQGNRTELCGDRLDLRAAALSPPAPAKAPAPGKTSAQLYVAGRYEWYFCRPPVGDLFNPGPPRLLFRQDGAARFDLAPRIDGQGIALDLNVAGVAAEGALGRVLDVRAVGEFLRARLAGMLGRALGPESLRVALPPELAELRPRFERVRFVDRGAGRLALVADGRLRIPLEAFEGLAGRKAP